MGEVVKLQRKPPPGKGAAQVTCTNCGERHFIARLPGGKTRCPTAFLDSETKGWFCVGRGCRAKYLAGKRGRP